MKNFLKRQRIAFALAVRTEVTFIKETIAAKYKSAIVFRDCVMNRVVDALVNLEPLTGPQNFLAGMTGIAFLAFAIVVNFRS